MARKAFELIAYVRKLISNVEKKENEENSDKDEETFPIVNLASKIKSMTFYFKSAPINVRRVDINNIAKRVDFTKNAGNWFTSNFNFNDVICNMAGLSKNIPDNFKYTLVLDNSNLKFFSITDRNDIVELSNICKQTDKSNYFHKQ